MAKRKTARPLNDWLRNPSSWISLSAAVLSAVTFFYVYADKGTIRVLLPYRIGIGISRDTGNVVFVVPATFSNSGAPRTRRHIRHISGQVRSLDERAALDGAVQWTYEHRFAGAEEHLKKFPQKKDKGHVDYLEYLGRAMPFTLAGGESVSKISELEYYGNRITDMPAELQIELILHTEDGAFAQASTYACAEGKLVVGTIEWCELRSPPAESGPV